MGARMTNPLVASGRLITLLLVLALTACGGRRPPLPDVSGPLADVIVRAAFGGQSYSTLSDPTGWSRPDSARAPAGSQPLLLDSLSFTNLGVAAGAAAFSPAELERQVGRSYRLANRRDVLACPDREPCRIVDDGTYIEVWEAEATRDGLDVVVSRVFNVQGLHVMTRAVTHRLSLRRENGAWRLTALNQLPS
jgi:hypothetical protein